MEIVTLPMVFASVLLNTTPLPTADIFTLRAKRIAITVHATLRLVIVFAPLVGRTICSEMLAAPNSVLLIVQVTELVTMAHAHATLDGEVLHAALFIILATALAIPLMDYATQPLASVFVMALTLETRAPNWLV